MKDILTQASPDGKGGKWIAKLLQYDIDIKPTRLLKGQGLEKMMAQSNFDCLDMNLIAEISKLSDEDEK